MQILEVLIFALGIGTLELSEFLIYQSQCDDKKFIFIYTDLRFKAKKVVMRVSFISSFSFFLILHARKAITRKKFLSPETNSHLCYYVCNQQFSNILLGSLSTKSTNGSGNCTFEDIHGERSTTYFRRIESFTFSQQDLFQKQGKGTFKENFLASFYGQAYTV